VAGIDRIAHDHFEIGPRRILSETPRHFDEGLVLLEADYASGFQGAFPDLPRRPGPVGENHFFSAAEIWGRQGDFGADGQQRVAHVFRIRPEHWESWTNDPH